MASYRHGTGPKPTQACASCHVRKIKCDLMFRGKPPCTRCTASNIPCNRFARRRRVIQAVEAIATIDSDDDEHGHNPSSSTNLDEVATLFSSLGVGDSPRKLNVPGFGDISKQSSILVDFLSQDFSAGAINDYQVTFNDDYTSITRILANEFGRGFEKDIYHYRDAPFVERTQGGIPRNPSPSERAILDLQGSFVLPSPKISDSFVLAFFDRVHPTLPIIDRFSFLKHYYSISTNSSNISLLLVQSILLSGSTTFKHDGLNLPPEEVSWKLYTRAKALIENRFEQDRLTIVQSHLLISTFASDSCDDTIQNMWLSLGSAVRVAQGLGMHRTLGKANASESMRRQWKRIWWSLFVHDTLCSFEWGRPRAINLADSDVEELDDADFQADEPGSLSSWEHTHFFLQLCKLCFIISEWLDLLRPGGPRNKKKIKTQEDLQATLLFTDLQQWYDSIPLALQAPKDCKGFSLWTATLQITYQAALLRFSARLPGFQIASDIAAAQISLVCEDLDRQGLLGSLWGFGIHEFDLAMAQHARSSNSSDSSIALVGLENLRKGLPWLRRLCKRSSVASQGLVFYEELISKFDSSAKSQLQVSSVNMDTYETQPHVDTNFEWEVNLGLEPTLSSARIDGYHTSGWGDYQNQFNE